MTAAHIEVLVEDRRWASLKLETVARRACVAALRHLGLSVPAEIAILAGSDARVAALNADFRGKPAPTNVLSWPATELEPPELPRADPTGEPVFLGDIALAYETCSAEAEAAGKKLEAHVTHLTVHAVLHLLGYDHESDEDAALMEALEVAILAALGQASPY